MVLAAGLEAADEKQKNDKINLQESIKQCFARVVMQNKDDLAWEDPWASKDVKWTPARSSELRKANDSNGELWRRFKLIQSWGSNVASTAYVEYQTASFGKPPSGACQITFLPLFHH